MTQNGPRNVQPLKKMAQAFHPDESVDFSAVETPEPVSCSTPTPAATATETDGMDDATPTETGGMDDATATETTSDGGPGFTAAGALVALLAGALIARRRR
jgi:iron complex transport system substrate-binding protein